MSDVEVEAPIAEPPVEELPEVDLGEGWTLASYSPEQRVATSETQGELRVIPASYRAEKLFDGTRVEVEADSEELLATRTEAYDAHRDSLPISEAPVLSDVEEIAPLVSVNAETGEEEEVEAQHETVLTEEGRYLESDWAAQSRADTILTDEGQKITGGAAPEITDDVAAKAEAKVSLELQATSEEPTDGANQLTYDTADSVDSPGQSAGGTIVVPEGIDTLEEASQAMDEASAAAENERVLAGASAEEPEAAAPQAAEVNATAGAIEAAEELGVDLAAVEGTGADGKITKPDVERHAAEDA